jgi:predicted DNA-binding transcriptional regulator AlpA
MPAFETIAYHEKRLLAHRDRVLTFAEWCAVNGFSVATGHRLIKAGNGPPVIQLSPRRLGVRESDNAAWQQSRVRKA